MRLNRIAAIVCFFSAPSFGQALTPASPDTAQFASKADLAAVQSAVASAQASATTANNLASTAVQPAALATAATQNLAIMAATTPQFVGGSTAYIPLATLLASYPCATGTLGMLAHVSDAWGSVATTLVCESGSGLFYWRPQRADYAATIAQTSGTLTLTPLQSAPIIVLSATPTAQVTIALSTTNAWPGAQFHIYAPAIISLNGVNISGLIGGGTVPLVQGSDKVVTFTGSGWRATS